MKTVPAAEFKNNCLALLDEVMRTRQRLIVTRHGKPVAQIQPFEGAPKSRKNPLKGSVLEDRDIVSPLKDKWVALE